jgi:hypothetical protein
MRAIIYISSSLVIEDDEMMMMMMMIRGERMEEAFFSRWRVP